MPTLLEHAATSIERAKKVAAAGFSTEAGRKDAVYHLANAYGSLKRMVSDAVWAKIRDRKDSAAEQRDWDLSYPYELHNVRQKHHDYALEMAPSLKDVIDQIAALKALRDEYRAMPVIKKVKAPVVIQPGDKTQLRGHCQCCGRLQAVNTTVAKHGYEVKDRGQGGYFRGVCSGHQFEPMETRRDAADLVVAQCRKEAAEFDELAAKLRDGKIHPATVQGKWNLETREYDRIPYAQGTAYQQRDAMKAAIWNNEQQARAARQFADFIEELANKVHGQPLLVVKV